MEWVKINILMWFGHTERKKDKKFLVKLYVSETKGTRRKGRPAVRLKDRLKSTCRKELLILGEVLN